MLRFDALAGPQKGEVFNQTNESIVVGRVNADISLKDRDVSRKHAVIEVMASDQIFIRDLASTNGTYVNGKRIANCRIKPDDVIRVGSTELKMNIYFK